MFSIQPHRILASAVGARRGLNWRRGLASAVAFCAVLASAAHGAETLAAPDRQAIELVIRAQLDAFGRDDADGAFAVAAPDIQRQFRTADRFLAAVREAYEPVYRPADVLFLKLEFRGGQWVQSVRLIDGDGKVWQALYTMRRLADHSWKIGGCRLVATDALAT
jgi:Domain of unknown function (DUF4864)